MERADLFIEIDKRRKSIDDDIANQQKIVDKLLLGVANATSYTSRMP
nr:hypothetical protein [Providencia stuartii]